MCPVGQELYFLAHGLEQWSKDVESGLHRQEHWSCHAEAEVAVSRLSWSCKQDTKVVMGGTGGNHQGGGGNTPAYIPREIKEMVKIDLS